MKSIILILIALMVVSCGSPFDEPTFNTNGGIARSNSYEQFKDFVSNFIEVKTFDTTGKSGANFEPLVIGNFEFWLIGSGSYIAYINQDKMQKFIEIEDASLAASRPAADGIKNIYFVTLKGNIYSYSIDGKKRFELPFANNISEFETFSDVLSTSNGVYFGSSSGRLIKIDFDGRLIYEKQFGAAISRSFSADKDGNIYIGITHNLFGATDTLAMLDTKGELVFSKPIDNVRLIRNPIVSDDVIYIAGQYQTDVIQGSLVACYDKTGFERWRQEIPVFPRHISINRKGDLYVCGFNTGVGEGMSGLIAYNRSGKQIWRLYITATVSAPMIIGKKKIAIVGNTPNGSAIFFLDKGNGKMIADKALNEVPPFYSVPAVLGDGSLVFSINDRIGIVRVTDTSINKILPW